MATHMSGSATQDSCPDTLNHGSRRRSSSFLKYNVAGTMDRVRSNMVGGRKYSIDEAEEPYTWNYNTATDSQDEDQTTQLYQNKKGRVWRGLSKAASQVPAIVLIGLFHLMIGIPFGVSYFPIGWRNDMGPSDEDNVEAEDGVRGPFPLPGKEALGIRMFLFSTVVGQVVFTLKSKFHNPIGLQMVENVPFCHALSHIVVSRQGYGRESLSTLMVMFGLASVIVGVVFLLLGKFRLGRLVYYFPTHVLVGCIGGIGLYIGKTGIEVTMNAPMTLSSMSSSRNLPLLGVVILFEVILRCLERLTKRTDGTPKYALLSPIYFCSITPVFYTALLLFRVDLDHVMEAGYFFPSLQDDNASNGGSIIWNEHLLDMWRIIDFSVVSWGAIMDSIPTLVALVLFSLIHVPINIPAFALSTNTEAEMNTELVAHGYSNMIAGCLGGLQNYMAYTQSVLYDRSGGTGQTSGLTVAAITALLFFIGPTIASYIPRCMAGTLLLHVGIDLFLEGVYDSYGKFDNLEYAGIWLITIVMTLYGMDAAMIAGVITAISTFVAQNMTYVNPVRGSMSASTLRSSQLNRHIKAREILDDPYIGRGRILVIQLQGHLFFGNMAHLTESIHQIMSKKLGTVDEPMCVILDFSLVLGIDSSAAQTMSKLKNVMQKQFNVQLSIFVSGSDEGFPCAFDLSKELTAAIIPDRKDSIPPDETTELLADEGITRVSSQTFMESLAFSGSHVCDSLDMALVYAENALIDSEDPSLLEYDESGNQFSGLRKDSSLSEEREAALHHIENLCLGNVDKNNAEMLFSRFERQVYTNGECLWKQGSTSDCFKLLIRGSLEAMLENEAGTSETILSGNSIGELGLVEGVTRMSSVHCTSQEAVLYSLSRDAYEDLIRSSPHVARLVDLICVRYLSARVQHVSNRIFETRCLPI